MASPLALLENLHALVLWNDYLDDHYPRSHEHLGLQFPHLAAWDLDCHQEWCHLIFWVSLVVLEDLVSP